MSSIRLFAALPIPQHISAVLYKWTVAERSQINFRKWAHPQDYHITLQFLGDVRTEQLAQLIAALRLIESSSLQLTIGKAGIFGLSNSPRVLWSAIDGDIKGLHALQQAIVKETDQLGFEEEKRGYHPHLTIARKYIGAEPFSSDVAETIPSNLSWQADHFTLMKTNMNASPMYEVIGEFGLYKG